MVKSGENPKKIIETRGLKQQSNPEELEKIINEILLKNKDKVFGGGKSKVKFRSKINLGYNAEKRFLDLFGPNCIEKVSLKSLKNTILESRLMIVTYPETVFSESMNANIPTILIIDKNEWPFSKKALQTFIILWDFLLFQR